MQNVHMGIQISVFETSVRKQKNTCSAQVPLESPQALCKDFAFFIYFKNHDTQCLFMYIGVT